MTRYCFDRTTKVFTTSALLASLLLLINTKAVALEEFELDSPFIVEEDIPVVLTAARLKQPRAEVPASVTVISEDEIQAWGVRSLPELMRFVPGMFIGHGDDENNPSVIYHASNPNIMRRLQVLVDGRSVFKAAIASVVWDDIPVALEDIARIEVTRGPNAATYGANSYLGVINIITKHPGDTLGTRVRYRHGNQGYDDSFVSYSGVKDDISYRLSAQINAEDSFDGEDSRTDEFRNSRRHGFVTAYVSRHLDSDSQLDIQASYKQGHTDIRKESFDIFYPDQETEQGFLWTKYSTEFDSKHSAHFQAYWQIDDRTQDTVSCVPTIGLDPDLFNLYQSSPYLSNFIGQYSPQFLSSGDPQLVAVVNGLFGGIVQGALSPEQVEQNLEALLLSSETNERDTAAEIARKKLLVEQAISVSQNDLNLATKTLQRAFNGMDFSRVTEQVCGNTARGFQEQRFDIEWQDTVQWSDTLRTVSGFSLRRDQINSETLFGGFAHNDTYRLFANAEWRPTDWLVVNAGGMYEIEDHNDNAFSPRIAANFLLTPQQSIRAVYSEAVRSPDLLEQTPNYTIEVSNLAGNYLGFNSAPIYVNQANLNRNLNHEKISSIELGYYGKWRHLEWDLKVYKDSLTQVISNPIALNTIVVTSDSRMDVDGAEAQLTWNYSKRNWLRLISAYVNTNYSAGNTAGMLSGSIRALERVELRASPRDSLVASWHHAGDNWSATASHFWYESYGDSIPNSTTQRRYRRYEVNLRKEWMINGYSPWAGVFWHHIIDDNPLVYKNQSYATTDLYYLQIGMNF